MKKAKTVSLTDRLELIINKMKLKETPENEHFEEKITDLTALIHYLSTILSTINQGILFVDLQGKITTFNHSAERILNLEIKKALFHDYWSLFPDDLFGFSMKQALIEKKAPEHALLQLKEKDLEVDTSFIIQSQGVEKTSPLQGVLILLRDTTQLRHLEREAQRKSRMNELGEMVSVIAHELRNPLGGIKGFASLLERDLKDRPELAKMASYIVKGTENLNDLVTRALNYSRPLQIQLKKNDLVPFIKEVAEHVTSDLSLSEKVKFSYDIQCNHCILFFDHHFLKSALLNLILNAIQATPKGGSVSLDLKKSDNGAQILVRDTGIGIPKENMKKIFSPFFTTRSDGNGLGLSEVQKVIQEHDGTLSVDSVIDKGTLFTIELPEGKKTKKERT